MNTKNAKIFSIIALILLATAMIIGMISLIIFVKEFNAYIASIDINNYDSNSAIEFSVNLREKLDIFLRITKLLGLPTLIFTILTAVEANKLKENRTPFILILIGFLVSIVGIVGIILLLIEINKIEKTPPPTIDDNYSNHVEF